MSPKLYKNIDMMPVTIGGYDAISYAQFDHSFKAITLRDEICECYHAYVK